MKHLKAFLLFTFGITTGSILSAQQYTFGLVGKSQSNPVFQVARVGAEQAAKDLGKKHGVSIAIDWRTPNEEDGQKQAEAIEQLVLSGAAGIAVSCSDANKLTDAIDDAVDMGVPVVTFDSDAPRSKRFATYAIDDIAAGAKVMDELAVAMGEVGVVAILAGNQNAPNLQKRAQGVRMAAKKYPGIEIRDTYYHRETPQDAVARIEQVMQSNPDVTGWALIGGWPLFSDDALKWQPGEIMCVSVDALPAQLKYLRNGQVQELLAQQVYEWGYQSVVLLFNKIHLDKSPSSEVIVSDLIPVTPGNVDEYEKQWMQWMP